MKIRREEAVLSRANGRTDITKLTVGFRVYQTRLKQLFEFLEKYGISACGSDIKTHGLVSLDLSSTFTVRGLMNAINI
jgi:hypothetical protein